MTGRDCVGPLGWGALALAALLLAAQPQFVTAEDTATGGIRAGQGVRLLLGGEGIPQSGFWIGIGGHEVDSEIAEKLGLKADQGVVVDAVVPDGPAAKAALAKDDVILSVGDKPVGSVEKLAEAIGASKGKEIQLKIQRAGKKMNVEVTPAKRPAQSPLIIREEEEEEQGEHSKEAKARLQGLLRELHDRNEKTRGAPRAGELSIDHSRGKPAERCRPACLTTCR